MLGSAMAAATAAAPTAPALHGAMEVPMSRSYLCYLEGPENLSSAACREALQLAGSQQFYDWHEVNLPDADGQHRELIPDGRLCSAGREKYRGLDLPRDDWPAQRLTPEPDGDLEFVYRATAPHSTLYFSFYITREGYDPTEPLRWSDLEDEPFCTVANPHLSDGRYHMRCPPPGDREGRHLIYNIWQRDDSPEAFYACSDVVFGEEAETHAPEIPAGTADGAERAQEHGSNPACRAAEWHTESVYVEGDVVSHAETNWRAKWWTRGEPPGTTGEWGVWEELGPC